MNESTLICEDIFEFVICVKCGLCLCIWDNDISACNANTTSKRMLRYLEADKTKVVIFVPTNLVTFCWLYKSKNVWVVIFVSAGGRVEAGGEGVGLLGAGSHDAGWPGSLPQQSHALRQGEHEWGRHITSGAIRQQPKLPAGQDHYGSFLLQM